jgi:hypothetical protein
MLIPFLLSMDGPVMGPTSMIARARPIPKPRQSAQAGREALLPVATSRRSGEALLPADHQSDSEGNIIGLFESSSMGA